MAQITETARLFWEDDYLKEMEARVISASGTRVIVDRTIFYPQGGGQACDTGKLTIGSDIYDVISVVKEDGYIIHEVDRSVGTIPSGANIHGQIDWDRRYHLMQVHTAQHIVSKAFSAICDLATAKAEITTSGGVVVLSDTPTASQLLEIEDEINILIHQDLTVKRTIYPDQRTVIAIGNYDVMGCGSPHVKNTSEVDKIKFYQRKGKTVYFEVGEQALAVTAKMAEAALLSSVELEVPYGDLGAEIRRLKLKLSEGNNQLNTYKDELKEYRIKESVEGGIFLSDGTEVIMLPLEMSKVGELKKILNNIIRPERVIVALTQGITLTVRSQSASVDARHVVDQIVKKLQIQGGGNMHSAQCGPIHLSNAEIFRMVSEIMTRSSRVD